jgi:F-type H+-transporting ATPase subunit epsilon
MHCVVRSADRTLYEGDADRIVARSPHGEFAVLSGHAPILAVLAAGALRIQDAEAEHVFVCKTGTFSLAHKQATILVERAYKLEEIDVVALREQLAHAQEGTPVEPIDSEEATYLELLCQVKERHA